MRSPPHHTLYVACSASCPRCVEYPIPQWTLHGQRWPLQATQQMMASAGGYGSQPPAYGAYGNPYGYGAPPAGPGYGGYAVPNAGGYGAAAPASGGHYYAPPRY